ncbi:hypothetical protein AOZ06_45675 [Kibdelosporangium phytohabitans]|uniref:Uncharacterized protein n=1 Tax=Kibdelosporangium phytohabitans TaxID=860235 RepID=A0A0N9IEK6_9PSEU|nr:hypothetical protein AOZ06_45675 [Kibdelosporangium phytohabitans]
MPALRRGVTVCSRSRWTPAQPGSEKISVPFSWLPRDLDRPSAGAITALPGGPTQFFTADIEAVRAALGARNVVL